MKSSLILLVATAAFATADQDNRHRIHRVDYLRNGADCSTKTKVEMVVETAVATVTVTGPAPTIIKAGKSEITSAPAPQYQPPSSQESPKTTQAPEAKPYPTPEPKPQPSGKPAIGADYKKVMLDAHNNARAKHNAPSMTWDDTIAEAARQLADSCVWEHTMNLEGGGYGQNLASTDDPSFATNAQNHINKFGEAAVTDMWYKGELPLYQYFGQEPVMEGFEKWGHLTQLLWKGSVSLGCYTRPDCPGGGNKTKGFYTVCNYKAQGNVAGEYAKNVQGLTNGA